MRERAHGVLQLEARQAERPRGPRDLLRDRLGRPDEERALRGGALLESDPAVGTPAALAVITLVNGIAEELFFRGAMYAAIPRHPVLWTSLAYVVATLATGNVMLAFAAILLGAVCGLERRASGGVLAPILTHVTWSLSMLFLLPLLF